MSDREALGRLVREVWIAWARENPVPCTTCSGLGVDFYAPPGAPDTPCGGCGGAGKLVKPSWVAPWEALTEPEREVDRRIADALARVGEKAACEACAAICDEYASAWSDAPGASREGVLGAALRAFESAARELARRIRAWPEARRAPR